MKRKVVVGILLGLFFCLLAVRNIDFREVLDAFRSVRGIYLVPILMLLLVMHCLRAFRWGVLLKPIERIGILTLLSVTSVGFLAITVIPARVGELARPYLISRKTTITASTALGSIFIERLFDVLSIMIMASVVACCIPLPSRLVKTSLAATASALIVMAMVITLILNRRRARCLVRRLLQKIPQRISLILEKPLSQFLNGLEVMVDAKRAGFVMGLSLLIWSVGALVIYILFFAFDFSLPPVAALAVLAIVIVGTTVPAAPGYIGTWHYFCILGLTIFSIPKADAMAFAIVHHFLNMSVIIILGLAFIPFSNCSLKNVRTLGKQSKL